MDIEVREYVRIKHMYNGTKIAKIKAILSKDPCYKDMQMYEIDVVHQHSNGHFKSHKIYEEDIIKHSKNIIDLIEVGDFVNGNEITEISQDPFVKGQINLWTDIELRDVYGDYERLKYICDDIKTIVTKEQFSQMEYKLEE